MKSIHLMSHGRKKTWACDLCSAKFHAKSVLKDHLKAHSCIKEYKCEECEKTFETVRECSDHVCPKWQRFYSVAVCPRCKSFVKKSSLERHSTVCREKQGAGNSNSNAEELWDECGEFDVAGDEKGERDNLSESMSDESDPDDVSEVDENSQEMSALDAAWKCESLDLECGIAQLIKHTEYECEEDTDEEEPQYSNL